MNLRWAYSRTLARPTFRELAPYASFDFIGDFILVGNNNLERTLIDNVDFRWEWYPNFGEIFAVGAFYKHFNNPIERTFNIQAANPELTYRNVDKAHLAGIELEIRKNLGFLSPKMENFSFGFNASYIYSRVDIDSLELVAIRALNPDASSSRQMFGQSPFLINLLLSYQNQKGTSMNLAFNIQGKQISVIGFKGNPNVFQMPIPNLNFTFDQELKNGWSLRFKAQNLLNAVDREKQFLTAVEDGTGEVIKTEYIYQSARYGVDLSFGVRYIIK
jgi:outer membrane receptor protein involved in Fe transport